MMDDGELDNGLSCNPHAWCGSLRSPFNLLQFHVSVVFIIFLMGAVTWGLVLLGG